MTDYRVIWKIDIEADSALKAAQEALEIQRDKDSIATVFKVIEKRSCEEWEVNLEDYK